MITVFKTKAHQINNILSDGLFIVLQVGMRRFELPTSSTPCWREWAAASRNNVGIVNILMLKCLILFDLPFDAWFINFVS